MNRLGALALALVHICLVAFCAKRKLFTQFKLTGMEMNGIPRDLWVRFSVTLSGICEWADLFTKSIQIYSRGSWALSS